MILATVGNHTQAFDRLIQAIDNIAPTISEEILIQVGISRYKPVNAAYFGFVGESEMDQLMAQASMIISHSGVASLLKALFLRKPTIIVPRSKKFGEHIDDHQLELAMRLSHLRGIKVVDNIASLSEAIRELRGSTPLLALTSSRLLSTLQGYLELLRRQKKHG
jgi:UDP-N-acetylglucosamine transferase subunit ALG13